MLYYALSNRHRACSTAGSRKKAGAFQSLCHTVVICLILAGSHANAQPETITYQYQKPENVYRIAIIIDDIGYNIPLGKRTIALDVPLTLAVLPFTPGARLLAEAGFASGKEIMLHAPMSNYNNKLLGPGALTHDMDRDEFLQVLRASIVAVPHVRGINNHMGSKLTTMEEPMQWLMTEIKRHGFYFIDSLTNSDSVALKTARLNGVISQRRDIFLDNEQDEAAIELALEQVLQRARRNGFAIAIGHPYPETLSVLERRLPGMEAAGFELLTISQLMRMDTSAVIDMATTEQSKLQESSRKPNPDN